MRAERLTNVRVNVTINTFTLYCPLQPNIVTCDNVLLVYIRYFRLGNCAFKRHSIYFVICIYMQNALNLCVTL